MQHRLDDDRAVHLRLADASVDERDRDLRDRETLLQRTVGRLDLEAVALRGDCAEVDSLQHAAAEALEAAGEIAHGAQKEDHRPAVAAADLLGESVVVDRVAREPNHHLILATARRWSSTRRWPASTIRAGSTCATAPA